MATCVINSINICRDMLHTPEVRSAFKELATEYSILRPKAWFLQGPATEEQMARLSEDFIDKVLTTFPYVFVDDSMKNPVRMAVHWRNKWDSDFKFSDQYITLNGLRLRHMLAAAMCANSSEDEDDLDQQDHRAFLFMFANCLLHEISHVFFTYLGKGTEHTPPIMKANMTDTVDDTEDKTMGESGRKLELLVFGGAMDILRDAKAGTPDDRCGTPYMNVDGGWHRVTQETIERTVKSEFKFPYDTSADESDLVLEPIGWGKPASDPTDPLVHPDWPKLRDASLSTDP
ncbi:MAG: hypothetical protein ASARMPREDX12_008046 [Alectoria sarmentosa]|nr:MAG: hypothetical protein ASARMPREDX12_008046 [Alectoria sarmentosa]